MAGEERRKDLVGKGEKEKEEGVVKGFLFRSRSGEGMGEVRGGRRRGE